MTLNEVLGRWIERANANAAGIVLTQDQLAAFVGVAGAAHLWATDHDGACLCLLCANLARLVEVSDA